MNLTGHYWSIAPNLRHRLIPKRAPAARPWSIDFETLYGGHPVRLSGLWREEPGADTAVLVIHGLGGTYDRQYCVSMAQAAARRGWSCLRLALRGADRQGTDFYHAGLVEDLDAAWTHECLREYRTIHVAGFSLGGHSALRLAAAGWKERMGSVAAVCPPVDLDYCATHLDHRAPSVYRRHVLEGLNDIYASVAARAEVPTPVERMKRIQSIREWDSLSIVPRFGYASVEEYYRNESVVGRLGDIEGPTWIVASENDPMIPVEHLRRARASASRNVRWILSAHGGHVGFPPRMSFGRPGTLGWPDQICGLLESVGGD